MKKEKAILLAGLALILILLGVLMAGMPQNQNNKNVSVNLSAKIAYNLWNYTIDASSEFNMPVNYQDFIMPDNPIVQEYAEQLLVRNDLWSFEYKNGTPFYIASKEDENETDYWQNPALTLSIGFGDCEDMALVAGSILETKKIDSVIVGGYVYNGTEKDGHSWVEYYYNDTYYISSNLWSFERNMEIENGIHYYYSPEVTLIPISNDSDNITIPKIKFQPRHIFNKKLKKMPYNKDWIILT